MFQCVRKEMYISQTILSNSKNGEANRPKVSSRAIKDALIATKDLSHMALTLCEWLWVSE